MFFSSQNLFCKNKKTAIAGGFLKNFGLSFFYLRAYRFSTAVGLE